MYRGCSFYLPASTLFPHIPKGFNLPVAILPTTPTAFKLINFNFSGLCPQWLALGGHLMNPKKISNVNFNVILQIPPPPPRPDFDASREKLQKLGEGEGNMTNEEFKKMKQELEA